jgi:hypothetical protein
LLLCLRRFDHLLQNSSKRSFASAESTVKQDARFASEGKRQHAVDNVFNQQA